MDAPATSGTQMYGTAPSRTTANATGIIQRARMRQTPKKPAPVKPRGVR